MSKDKSNGEMIIRGVEMEACIQGITENLMPFLECRLSDKPGWWCGHGTLVQRESI